MEDTRITIMNLTKQPKNFVLPHQLVCIKLGKCLCKNGLPASIHILVGQSVEAYRAALNAPDIKKALAKKQIAIGQAKTKQQAASHPASKSYGGKARSGKGSRKK